MEKSYVDFMYDLTFARVQELYELLKMDYEKLQVHKIATDVIILYPRFTIQEATYIAGIILDFDRTNNPWEILCTN